MITLFEFNNLLPLGENCFHWMKHEGYSINLRLCSEDVYAHSSYYIYNRKFNNQFKIINIGENFKFENLLVFNVIDKFTKKISIILNSTIVDNNFGDRETLYKNLNIYIQFSTNDGIIEMSDEDIRKNFGGYSPTMETYTDDFQQKTSSEFVNYMLNELNNDQSEETSS